MSERKTSTSKKVSRVGRKRTVQIRKRAVSKKKNSVLDAKSIGVADKYVLTALPAKSSYVFQPFLASIPKEHSEEEMLVSAPNIFYRPLVSQRTSFWLGVGFGVLIVGVLGFTTWQLLRFEIVEAVMVGF